MTSSFTIRMESLLDRQLAILRARSGINDFQLVNGGGHGGNNGGGGRKRYILVREQDDVQIQLNNNMSRVAMYEALRLANQILCQMNNNNNNNDGYGEKNDNF